MDVIRLIRILLRRVKLLILIPLFAMLLTYLLTLKMENVYKAQAQIAAGIVDESKFR
jgi:capsular polysaccharide biosynthesis protein